MAIELTLHFDLMQPGDKVEDFAVLGFGDRRGLLESLSFLHHHRQIPLYLTSTSLRRFHRLLASLHFTTQRPGNTSELHYSNYLHLASSSYLMESGWLAGPMPSYLDFW